MKLDTLHIALIIAIIILIIIVYSYYNDTRGNTTKSSCSCGQNCQCNRVNKKIIELWAQHLLYTRLVLISFFNDDNELALLTKRLEQNQYDIGDYFSRLFNKNVGNTVTSELLQHIAIATNVLKSVKDGDPKMQKYYIDEFYKNADSIGIYLDHLFKNNDCTFKHHMKMHIDTLVANVVAYTSKNYNEDIKSLDKYVNAGLDMAFEMAV